MTLTKKELGDRAEEIIAQWLLSQGIHIIDRNLRLGSLEIDIVAREANVIIVVEVRSRGTNSWTTGFSSVDNKKRFRLRRAGKRLWNLRYQKNASVDHLRFDVASVTFNGETPVIEYARAAF